jgi:hypothetical protein
MANEYFISLFYTRKLTEFANDISQVARLLKFYNGGTLLGSRDTRHFFTQN